MCLSSKCRCICLQSVGVFEYYEYACPLDVGVSVFQVCGGV